MSEHRHETNVTIGKDALIKWGLRALIALGGLAGGLWSESLDRRLNDLDAGHLRRFDAIENEQRAQHKILEERAGLAPKLDETARQTDDQEIRLRALERDAWRQRR